jgi:hypothetical protein
MEEELRKGRQKYNCINLHKVTMSLSCHCLVSESRAGFLPKLHASTHLLNERKGFIRIFGSALSDKAHCYLHLIAELRPKWGYTVVSGRTIICDHYIFLLLPFTWQQLEGQ